MTKPSTAGCDDWNTAERALYDNLSVVPYASVLTTVFANKATFDPGESINPASIRMYR